MLLYLLVPLAAALAAPWLVRWLGRPAVWALAAVPLALAVQAARTMPAPGEASALSLPWAPALGADVVFLWDGLSASFVLLAAGVGAAVVLHAGGYLLGDAGLGRLVSLLLLFLTAMIGLILSDNAITLFVFWELTGIVSFLLIAFKSTKAAARKAARNALLVTGAGGLALLVGLLLGGLAASDLGVPADQAFRLSAWTSVDLTSHPHYLAILVLVAVGAMTKSAQAPVHFWLSGAMTAPTPVSAFLHSATLVKAGIFLLARLSGALGGTTSWWALLGIVGGTTMLVGALAAVRARDLKSILAGSTVSVLGILTLLLGDGSEEAVKAAVVFLFAHGLYKSSLFLVAGNIDVATGTRELGRLGGLARALPMTAAAGALAALSKAGAPPSFGFIGKELVYKAKLAADGPAGWILLAAIVANVALVATAMQVGLRPFFSRAPAQPMPEQPPKKLPFEMMVGPIVLAAGGLFVGLIPGLFAERVGSAAASSILGQSVRMKLELWHGFNLEALIVLALSAVTLGAGVAIYLWLGRWGERAAAGPSLAGRLWDAGLDALLTRVAPAITRVLHPDSLRRNVAWILGAAVLAAALPALSLLGTAGASLTWAPSADTAVGAGLAIAGALAAVAASSRWVALVAVGVTGVGLTLLFALHSGPDLAITQVLVEALAVLLLLLVLRGVPRSTVGPRRLDLPRTALSLGAGLVAAVGVAVAATVSVPTDLAEFVLAESAPSGKGRNVVNVILVDFRAFDTFGEIVVVALAAIGAVALLSHLRSRRTPGEPPAAAWDSVILTAASKPLLAVIIVFSLFLLLRGHDQPGGGFSAGLLAAAGFAVRALAAGPAAARHDLRVSPGTLLGVGLALALGAGLLGLLVRGAFLAHLWAEASIPALGKVGTALVFDAGVYLVVLGAVQGMLIALEEA